MIDRRAQEGEPVDRRQAKAGIDPPALCIIPGTDEYQKLHVPVRLYIPEGE